MFSTPIRVGTLPWSTAPAFWLSGAGAFIFSAQRLFLEMKSSFLQIQLLSSAGCDFARRDGGRNPSIFSSAYGCFGELFV